jgi:hypothetical protein
MSACMSLRTSAAAFHAVRQIRARFSRRAVRSSRLTGAFRRNPLVPPRAAAAESFRTRRPYPPQSAGETTMIVNILEHTPTWVWILFAGLLVLGLSQIRTREVSKTRATILPLIMVALSLSGVLSAFGQVPIALAGWVVGVVLTLHFLAPLVGVRGALWLPGTNRFRVQGSWIPVTLIVGVFLTKYVAGVAMAIHPPLAANTPFALVLSLVYGLFAGLFWGRARSLRVLSRDARAAQPA